MKGESLKFEIIGDKNMSIRIMKLLEVSPSEQSDDWGELITTEGKVYEEKEMAGDMWTRGREIRERKENENIPISARVTSARMRAESGRQAEKLAGLEERLQAMEERRRDVGESEKKKKNKKKKHH